MDWRQRAQISDNVVFFGYVEEKIEHAAQEVFVWDLDKTYLDTTWESWGQMLQNLMDRAFHRKNVPGTNVLLRALASHHNSQMALYFITASPPQLEERVTEKLISDRIFPYGCYYKDNLKNLRPGRFKQLTHHVGYKIQALLQLRSRLSDPVRQVFWGDDSESDAVVYNLYSDICARRLSGKSLTHILRAFFVSGEQIDKIHSLQSLIPPLDPLEKIYINLAEDTDADYYLKFGRRTIPTVSSFQTACDLFQDGRLSIDHVIEVARDLLSHYKMSVEFLSRELDDLVRRQILAEEVLHLLIPTLQNSKCLAKDYAPSVPSRKIKAKRGMRVFELEGIHEPWVPERIDYLHDYR